MKIAILLMLGIGIGRTAALAQQFDHSVAVAGTIGMSVHSGTSSVFFHLGGPGIGISYDRWAIRWQLYPSVRWYIGPASSRHATVNSFTPILGTGLAIQYQHVLVLLPAYYLSSSNVWIVSVGVGLSFK